MYINKEFFIEKAKIVWGNKFDYSLVNLKNYHTKIEIICPIHGSFFKRPDSFLKSKSGCNKCSGLCMPIKVYIINANNIHNNKFDYSLIKNEYIKNGHVISIICPEHGVFEQLSQSHLKGHGCRKCGTLNYIKKSSKNNEKFICEAKIKHNNKFDYSLTHYINSYTKIKIICYEHGEFEQTPNSHLNGKGCNKCRYIRQDTQGFICEANIIHNNKYNYSLSKYNGDKKKIDIICSEHGIFKQTPNSHLSGSGCIKCAVIKRSISLDVFKNKSSIIHNNKYNYDFVELKTLMNQVDIICDIHGVFKQKAESHIRGKGCYKCRLSKGENKISKYLDDNNIIYIHQKKFNECIDIKELKFDFYLPEHNLCIEYDGKQHFEKVESWGGIEALEDNKRKDSIKNKFCEDNNINILRIKYTNFKNIEQILKDKINI